MKIAIIGNAGSGKSTLALKLHHQLHIPLYHLDQYFWKPNWVEPDRSEFEKIHNALCDKPAWIIEGMAIRFFAYRIEKADIVIFIDQPRYTCFYRVFKRAYNYFGKQHFFNAPGCPERGPSIRFLKFIWNFPYKQKKEAAALLEKYKDQKQIFVVNTQQQVNELLQKLSNTKS